MNLLDIISLAKAGYKKSDIEELLKIPVDDPDPDPNPADPDGSTGNPADPKGGPAPSPEDDPDDNKPDYEQLYNELRSELDKVKNDLKVAQQRNISHDNSGNGKEVSAWDDLADIARSYM